MTRSAQLEAGEVAHASPTTCSKDVAKIFALIDEGGGWLDDDEPRVTEVRQDGDRATAVLAAGNWRTTLPFRRQRGGTWRIASFIGVGAERLREAEAQSATSAFPAPGKRIQVISYSGSPCPPVLENDYPQLSGGCLFRVSDRGLVPVEMLSPYGGFKFGDCVVDYRVFVDGEGRTWTDEWEVQGDKESGCSDIKPCFGEGGRSRAVEPLPWRGRIVAGAGGDLLHRVRVCIRTCIGMFTGDLVTRMREVDGGWRLEPTDDGASGFKFAESLDVYGQPFEIKERAVAETATSPALPRAKIDLPR